MFADFDFRSKPRPSTSSASDAHGQKKKPSFKVPNAKELMDAFSSSMTGLSTAKPQPKLPPKSSVSIHDQLLLQKPPVLASPLRTGDGGRPDAQNGKKGKERQMTPLRAPQLVYPPDDGPTKEKKLVTPITSRTYKLDGTPARKVMPLNSLYGLSKADTGFPSSSSTSAPDASLRTLPGPKFSVGGGTNVPKTPLRGVTPAPFEVFVKPEGQFNAGEEGEDEHTRELNRGLLVSPEKESGRGRKFIRCAHMFSFLILVKNLTRSTFRFAVSAGMASLNAHSTSSHARGLRLPCGRKISNPPPDLDLCLCLRWLLHRYASVLIFVFDCSPSLIFLEPLTSTPGLPDHLYARSLLAALFFLDHRSLVP